MKKSTTKKILRATENLIHDHSILTLLLFHNSNTYLDVLTTMKKLISTYSVLGYIGDYKNNLRWVITLQEARCQKRQVINSKANQQFKSGIYIDYTET